MQLVGETCQMIRVTRLLLYPSQLAGGEGVTRLAPFRHAKFASDLASSQQGSLYIIYV